jgi:DNA-binding CsgD family transcriptional regulator
MTETLDRLDLPGAVLNSAGRVLSTNPLLDNMNEQFGNTAGGGLAILHPPANELLKSVLQTPPLGLENLQTSSIPVPATEKFPACVVHLVPVRRQARDIFTQAANILVVTPLGNPEAPLAHVLLGLFDLSPAEARIAQKLVGGNSIDEIAIEQKLSRETIRSQLKSVFSKTGTSRQAELVGLLMGTRIRAHK